MPTNSFSVRQVSRSFRKFNDITHDLMAACHQTWGNYFTQLIDHCENDPVMRVVVEPLRTNRNVDAQKWYEDALASVRGMVGSGRYRWPVNDVDRAALLYQFFLNLEHDKVDFVTFCVRLFGVSKYNEMVAVFNRELLSKFTRDVSYQLEEIVSDIRDEEEVPGERIVAFHAHYSGPVINAPVQGSNLAFGNSSISEARATYQTGADLVSVIESLRAMLGDVPEDKRSDVAKGIDTLAASANGEAVPRPQLVAAAETVANGSGRMRAFLKDVTVKAAGSLVAHGLIRVLQFVLG